jgi:hypothetical protein
LKSLIIILFRVIDPRCSGCIAFDLEKTDHMKPIDQHDRDWSKGNCFYVTLELIKDSDELRDAGVIDRNASVSLVHGILDAEGQRVRHAWIEIDNFAVDFSNGQEINVPAEDYVRDNNAQITRRFSRAEADALLGSLSSKDGDLPIGYWGDLSDNDVAAAIEDYDKRSGVFASKVWFSDPLDTGNANNLKIQSPHAGLKRDIQRVVEGRLRSLLAKCHWFSLIWKDELMELHLQEDEDSISSRLALRLFFIEQTTQVHIPNIGFPDSWRGRRIGMGLIRAIFEVCEEYGYTLFITDMVGSFHRYMLKIGAHRTDEDTVEILPTTRLV